MTTEAGKRLLSMLESVEDQPLWRERIAAIEEEAFDSGWSKGKAWGKQQAAERVRELPWTNTTPRWGDDVTLDAVLAILEEPERGDKLEDRLDAEELDPAAPWNAGGDSR
jgi:hypothetical protein